MDNLNSPFPPTSPRESRGPVIGIVVIIILLILGGILWQSKKAIEQPWEITTPEGELMTLPNDESGMSTNLNDIEADLSATDLSDLDASLNQLNTELGY